MTNITDSEVMGQTYRKQPRHYKFEIFLLILVWFVVGLTINSRNLVSFNLQQMGVESIVERGTFYVEGSKSPTLQPLGDVFEYEGHKYAAKQPGQFMIGAICYFFLTLFGLDYVSYYLLTSALVTFFSASLLTAISTVAVYRAAQLLSKAGSSRIFPLATALFYALGTTVLPYAGIAHHDSIASSFLAIAFYLVLSLVHGDPEKADERTRIVIIGVFLGLIVTTSMLVFWPAIAVGLYFVSLGRWRQLPYFILGGVLGLLPLLIYDTVNFGNPFLLPNVAGNYSDTFFHFTVSNFQDKFWYYLKSTITYAPIILLGLVGLWFLPRLFFREKLAIAGAFVMLCGYIFNIDSVGTCAYGARYFLPLMGVGCLGLVGFSYLEPNGQRYKWTALVLVVGLVGVVINIVGGLGGAMYCDLGKHAFMPHIELLKGAELSTFPLLPWLFIPTLMTAYFFIKHLPDKKMER